MEERRVNHFFCLPLPNPFKSLSKPKKAREQTLREKRVEDGSTTTDAIRALEDQLAQERAKFAKLKVEADAKAEANLKLEAETRGVKELLETRENDVGQRDAEIQRLESEGGTMRERLGQLQAADTRARELSAQLADKEKLLNERTTELSAAQVFLTKVDAVSEADVVGMVENLNTLITSASGAISDAWDEREPIPGTLVEESDLEHVRNEFGDLITKQIAARDHVAVNLAVQMHLSQFVKQITSGWGSGQAAGILAEVYGKISTNESQPVASRWRTLTKRYTPYQEPPQSDDAIAGLARILVITESFLDFEEAMEAVANSTGTEIKAIIEATVQLDDTIKTKISSSDMSVYVVLPGTDFSTETMDDEFGGDGPKEGEEPVKVAGTMEIGLLQRSGNKVKVLRNPKVILERDLVEPEGGNRA